MARFMSVRVNAGNDRNGNPRRGWLIINPETITWHFQDEGYEGWSGEAVKAVQLTVLEITPGQYRQLARDSGTRTNPRPRRTKRRQRLIRDMRFFRTHGGGIVGEAAKGALDLARAERAAHDRGWEYVYYPEEERYEDVYGLPDPGGEWVTVALKSQKGTVLASLGFVDANDHQYLRVVRAELAGEALSRGR